MTELFDFSYDRLTPAQVAAGGRVGVIRYVASGRPAVSATKAEVDSFLNAGMVFCGVWQRGRERPLQGRDGGVVDAQDAKAYCATLGRQPADPVYFAVDFNPTSAQWPTILAYFQGVASVLGWENIGAYANAPTITYLAGRCNMGLYWLHNWGSGGKIPAEANLHQYAIDVQYLGKAVDYNRAYKAYYGQWGQRDAGGWWTKPLGPAELAQIQGAIVGAME